MVMPEHKAYDRLREELNKDMENMPNSPPTSAQTLPLPLPALKTGWDRIYIENIGSVDLPPTMELQKGSFKEFVDNKLKSQDIPVDPYRLVAQQKGVNASKADFKKYARVIVETKMGSPGSYDKINFNINTYSKTDIVELDKMFKETMLQEFLQIKDMGQQRLIEWYPTKVEIINGMSCIHVSYTRQLGNNPIVLVNMFLFQNNDRLHTLTLSYRLSESNYWEEDFVNILKSFRITNIK